MFNKFTFKKKRENKGAVFAVGAVIGGLLGSVAAVFLTPVTGRKARETVVSKTKKSVNWATKEASARRDQLVKGTSKLASDTEKGINDKKTQLIKTTSKIASDTEKGIQSKLKDADKK